MPSRLETTEKMKSEFGEILLKGLDELDDDEFKKFKFYLRNDGLIKRVEKLDRTGLATCMIKEISYPSFIETFIKILNKMNLKEAVNNCQKQKKEVLEKWKKKNEKKPTTRNNQTQRRSASNDKNSVNPKLTKKDNMKLTDESKKNFGAKKRKATTEENPESKKRKLSKETHQKTEPETGREDGPQTTPIVVKVLKVNQIFEYETKEGTKKMFHATVANEHEFIRVKVLNINVKEHFNKNNVIEISKGFWNSSFLEVNRYSIVLDVGANREIEVPQNIIRKAFQTPKIQSLLKLKDKKERIYVDGVYEINKKTETDKCTLFEVKDDTGKIKVVAFGKWAKIKCDERDKLRLTGFELSVWNVQDEIQLKSVTHSYLKVGVMSEIMYFPTEQEMDLLWGKKTQTN
ncbi:interferon-inducible protein AIM2-like isoform X1 [Gracilinanus agilis]|uniref:interferon-inducible protein AIM2-like isoform X1 n=1 Tax=Gracilinanus agilis TaxID=191870 RepID=UPI001CFCE407|nr:interferon-inducible protein AIM2-like isoform X1 [Gracilinanus agilis]